MNQKAADDSGFLRPFLLDEMTGLYNRSYLILRVSDDICRSERYEWPLSLVMIELDAFDELTKKVGAPAANHVLVAVAHAFSSMARDTDLAGMLSPGRMCLVMPGTSIAGATSVAERMRDRIAQLPLGQPGQEQQVTVSAAVCEYSEKIPDGKTFLRVCSAALTRAIKAGGNRVVQA